MNKIKEKKLDAIKSEILEITDFVTSNINNKTEISDINKNTDKDSGQTLTLTKIVDFEKNQKNNNLIAIQDQLNNLESILIKHEKILQKILFKIK